MDQSRTWKPTIRSRPSWLTAAVFLLLMPLALGASGVVPVARFAAEQIDIAVEPHAIEVTGYYVYRNPLPFDWRQGLTVPFPEHPGQARPAEVELDTLTGACNGAAAPVPSVWLGGQPYLQINIPAQGSTCLRVRFRQYVAGNSATYLLLTTRPWLRPLEAGKYTLYPAGVRITGCNYALAGDPPSFARTDFFPAADWTFSWETQNAE